MQPSIQSIGIVQETIKMYRKLRQIQLALVKKCSPEPVAWQEAGPPAVNTNKLPNKFARESGQS